MFWSLLFAIGIAQGVFLTFVFARRKQTNPTAVAFLLALLALFALSNFDDLLLATGWFRSAPLLFGWSLAAVFAYGPLFWFYLRSVAEPDFRWQRRDWWHFAPSFLFFALYLPFIFWAAAPKIQVLETLLADQPAVDALSIGIGGCRVGHLMAYLLAAYWMLKKWAARLPNPASDLALREKRACWFLFSVFAAQALAVFALYAYSISTGFFSVKANGVFTIFSSSAMYFLSYKLILDPSSLRIGPAKKHASPRDPALEQVLLERLETAIQAEKIFTDPELNLARLAARLETPPHRLSALVNEKFGVSFSDYIARKRVEEFLARLSDPRFAHLSLHGLALEVGFNSKSAFNAAFKKITGKTPSDYRR